MRRCALMLLALAWLADLAGGSDWPMLAHDPQRTGWSADEVRAPAARKWYRSFHEEGLAAGLQPVIAGGRVYVGTLHGTLYCLSAEDGGDLWTYVAGGGILHSAAVADGAVYFAALDGKLYALDAADGTLKWSYQTGAPLWNAPLPAEGNVYVGGRDGWCYAIRAADGQLAWRAPVGGPILASCAYADGRLFVAGEDMKAYCFAAADGALKWSARLAGVSCRGYHPVVAGRRVFFVTQPGLGKTGPLEVLLEACREAGLRPPQPAGPDASPKADPAADAHNEPLLKDPQTLEAQLLAVRKIQQARPATRSFFTFDVDTGAEPWVAPVVWSEGCGGPANPPIVAPDGGVWLKYNLFTWAQRGERSPFARVGRLNLQSGLPEPPADPLGDGPTAGPARDEMARLSGAGGAIIHAGPGCPPHRGLASLDLAKGRLTVLGDNVRQGDATLGPTNLLRLIEGQPIPPGLELLTRGAGVFGGAGACAAAAVADGTLYHVPTRHDRSGCMLIAWAGQADSEAASGDPTDGSIRDETFRQVANLATIRRQPLDWDMLTSGTGACWPGQTGPAGIAPEFPGRQQARARQATAYADALTEADLEKYIWDLPAVHNGGAAPAELRHRLAQAIEELCGEEDWQPMHYPDQSSGGWYYLDDPVEPFTAVAAAWPALDERMRKIAGVYLRDWFRRHNPLRQERLDPAVGARRTPYQLPDYARLRIWRSRTVGLERLYPLWAWGNATGDWQQLREVWAEQIRPLIFDLRPPQDSAELLHRNDLLSGAIAYCRMARQFQDRPAEQLAVPVCRALLKGRIEAERTYTLTHFIQRQPNTGVPGRYLYLTPEIGRLMREHAREPNEELFDRYVGHHRPTWFIAWGPMTYDTGETSIDHPMNPWAAFCARAMLFADPGPTLESCLDIPWCKADLYYVHKLALAVQGYQ